jgi:hypothetical protein
MKPEPDEDTQERAEAAPAADPREEADKGPEGRQPGGQPRLERQAEAGNNADTRTP